MANGAGKPDIGYGKTIAALIGGLFSLILVYFIQRAMTGPFPAEIWAVAQTLITAAAVCFIPHTIGKP